MGKDRRRKDKKGEDRKRKDREGEGQELGEQEGEGQEGGGQEGEGQEGGGQTGGHCHWGWVQLQNWEDTGGWEVEQYQVILQLDQEEWLH